MASRPTARAVSKLARNIRQLHMTGPATYPSAILTETRTHDSSGTDAAKRPQAAAAAGDSAAPAARQFNTSRVLKAINDNSTIDFAYLPDQDPDAAAPEKSARVPLLLDTMYSGVTARAMYEETPEATLRPLINLVSADGTHIQAPSAMSEVVDNNAINFEGIASSLIPDAVTPKEAGAFRQVFNDMLDDLLGPRKTDTA